MKITWLGHASFLIEGEDTKIITDPYNSRIGFSMPGGLTSDIVTVSHGHNDHSEVSLIGGDPQVIDTVGIHESDSVITQGLATYHDKELGQIRGENIIFKIELDGITICHLGDLGYILSDEEIKQLGKIDILMIPVGGTYTIDSKEAWELASKIKPKIILPMHYQTPDLSLSNKLETIDQFLEAAILSKQERLETLSIDSENLLLGIGPKVVILDRKN